MTNALTAFLAGRGASDHGCLMHDLYGLGKCDGECGFTNCPLSGRGDAFDHVPDARNMVEDKPDIAADIRALHVRMLAVEERVCDNETMRERLAALESRPAWTAETERALSRAVMWLLADATGCPSRDRHTAWMTEAFFPQSAPEKPVCPDGCACRDHCGYFDGHCSYPLCPHAGQHLGGAS